MSALVQGTADWLEMRRSYIGASDAPVIMGVSPWKTPYQLWKEKLGLYEQETNKAMRRGTSMEETARREFELTTGYVTKPKVVFSTQYDWMMASLDGITDAGDVLVEIKCPGSVDHSSAVSGRVPDKYMPQMQHQMACTGLDHGYYFSFNGTTGALVEVERDDDYIKKLITKEQRFWESIQEMEAPELEDRDFHLRSDVEWTQTAEEYKSLRLQLKALELQEKKLKERLIDISGNSNIVGGGIKLSKVLRKGAVEYTKIPELIDVDLESYRKGPVEYWKVS